MSASDYYVGAFFFLATYGAVLAATEIVVRRRLPNLAGAVRAVAWATLATAALLAVHLLPAALTVLSREAVLAAALAMLAAAWWLVPPIAAPAREAGDRLPSSWERASAAERLLASVGLIGALLWLVAAFAEHAAREPTGFDAASAYLPTAARWLQEGSIWQIADWAPDAFYGSGPGNGSVLVLGAMLPWENDFLAHLAIYPYVVLLVVALYALARECGAGTPAAILLALMVSAAPVVVQPGLVDGLLDPVMYAALATGLLFLVRHHRSAARGDLVLAGIALGICFGTKFYGYTSVAAVIAVWAAARLFARVPPALVARQLLALGGLILAAGGIWMARNWIETGNPLMPLAIDPLGITIFDAPPDPQRPLFGDTLAGYLDQPAVWIDTLAHQFRIAVGLPLLALAAGLVSAAALLLRRRGRWRSAEGIAAAALAGGLLAAVVYAITPYSAPSIDGDPVTAAINVRYGIPAMIVALGALAWLAGAVGARARVAICAIALLATIDALRVGTVTRPAVVLASFGLALVLALALAPIARRGRPGGPTLGRRFVAAGAAALLALVVLAGERLQGEFNSDRYLGQDPAIDYVIERTAGDPATIGLAGTWSLSAVVPTYPSFGARLENRVEYVGEIEGDALLRAFTERAPFLAALERLDPRLLVIGRDETVLFERARPRVDPDRLAAWARSAGYALAFEGERLLVMERPRPAA